MKAFQWITFLLFNLNGMAQPGLSLWHDSEWPDTILPVKMQKDTLDSLDQYYHKQKSLEDLDFYRHRDGLYFIRKANGKLVRTKVAETYDYGQGIFFDDYGMKDVNGDGKSELVIRYHFDFGEYHWDDGWGYKNECIAVIDPDSSFLLFSVETKYSFASRYVIYFDEDKHDRNDANWNRKIKSEELSSQELEYALRFQVGRIELVCVWYLIKGASSEDMVFPNRGTIIYQWKKDKWIRSSE